VFLAEGRALPGYAFFLTFLFVCMLWQHGRNFTLSEFSLFALSSPFPLNSLTAPFSRLKKKRNQLLTTV
jgi:hypothetical protein